MLAAGIDIGNSTTEVVFADIDDGRVDVRGQDRMPTRGAKGSTASMDGAVALVERIQRRLGVRPEAAVASSLRPVTTRALRLPEPVVATGRLQVVAASARTTAGVGFGVGAPYLLTGMVPTGLPDRPVVALVPAGMGYAEAVPRLRELADHGRLAAVVVQNDEAVLIANRLAVGVPVVDEVPVHRLLDAELVAVEAAEPGLPLRSLTDPLRIVSALGLAATETNEAAALATTLYDRSNVVVAVLPTAPVVAPVDSGWVRLGGEPSARVPISEAYAALRAGRPGDATAYGLPPDSTESGQAVEDLFMVNLAELADSVLARVGSLGSRTTALAALDPAHEQVDPSGYLSRRLGIEVELAAETVGAHLGGISTPGATASATVVDLGGGTVDLVTRDSSVVAAGAGDLLTLSTAALLGSSRAVAEWAKRGPAQRVESTALVQAENGARTFTDSPVPAGLIGTLVVPGPAGLLPIDRTHSPGEWRALRLRLKADVLGANVARCLRAAEGRPPSAVILVGGPMGDDEVIASVARALPPGIPIGRGNAGGVLGHRYVVAYGLLLAAFGSRDQPVADLAY